MSNPPSLSSLPHYTVIHVPTEKSYHTEIQTETFHVRILRDPYEALVHILIKEHQVRFGDWNLENMLEQWKGQMMRNDLPLEQNLAQKSTKEAKALFLVNIVSSRRHAP